jgi:beta-galactosidase beta subunit
VDELRPGLGGSQHAHRSPARRREVFQSTVFKPESDTQKFAANDDPATQLILRAGDFVIFLPGEALRPKVAVREPASLKKLVVKIPAKMLDLSWASEARNQFDFPSWTEICETHARSD